MEQLQVGMISEQFQRVLDQIHAFEKKYQRPPGMVQLIAVSKAQSVDKIRALIAEGQSHFGENYLQEALSKIEMLVEYDLKWHFIGKVQSNKTRLIAQYFSWVQSVDRLKIAERLNEQRPAHMPPLNVCIEVNINQSTTKTGVHGDEVEHLAQEISKLSNLRLRGLMAIPEPTQDSQRQFNNFLSVARLQQKLIEKGLNLDTLSIGMSADFEMAIKAGSTMVRIGTAIFGSRVGV